MERRAGVEAETPLDSSIQRGTPHYKSIKIFGDSEAREWWSKKDVGLWGRKREGKKRFSELTGVRPVGGHRPARPARA